ncbi:hypothetical protein NIES22_35320 [Calothrix brevissima NIES-22]|nr:hypothetical protein NIES22_35320 [Calothrix brevissima NIES-22]
MIIKFSKFLCLLTYIVLLFCFTSGIALASPDTINSKSHFIVAQSTQSSSDVELSPLQRQRIQGLRQRRNREIRAILNSAQREQLAKELHQGAKLNQALEKLNLQPEQRELIQAILKFTNLKLKFMFPKNTPAI